MKISELIEKLKKVKNQDLDVCVNSHLNPYDEEIIVGILNDKIGEEDDYILLLTNENIGYLNDKYKKDIIK